MIRWCPKELLWLSAMFGFLIFQVLSSWDLVTVDESPWQSTLFSLLFGLVVVLAKRCGWVIYSAAVGVFLKKRAPTEGFSMLSTECTWVKLMQWRQNRPTNMFPCRFDLHLQILSFVIYELGQQWQKRKGGCKCTGVNWRNKRKTRSQPNKDAERKSGLGKYSNLQAVSLMDAEGSLQGLDGNTLASFALTSRLSDGNRNTIFGSFIPLSDGCIMIVFITCWKIQIKTKQVLQLQSVVGKSAPVQS